MTKALDVVLKTLVEIGPESWPAVVGMPEAPVQVIDADVSALGGAADKVLRVAADPPYLLHLEFFSGHDTVRAAKRLRRYNAVLDERHDLLVQSVAVLLRPEADSPQLTGELLRRFAGREPHVVFRYEVLRVWRVPAATFLNGSEGLWPLAPIGDVAVEDVPAVIDQMKQRLGKRKLRELSSELWTATFILLGMKHSRELALHLLRGITAMEESTTFQYIMELGEAKGMAKGSLEEARQLLFRIGRKRFGQEDPTIATRINAITDREQLEELVEQAIDVASWQELLPPPQRGRSRRRRPSSGG
jgi:predicted transposase YdaD